MPRVFRQTGKLKKIKEWRVWVEGNTLHMENGYVGHKMKHTWTRVKSVGKKGTKAYVAAEDQAILEMGRKITKKMEIGGYREVDPETGGWLVDEAVSSDGYGEFLGLPTNYAEFKPQKKPDEDTKKEKQLIKLANSDRGIITVKEDGMFYYVLITKDRRVRIYTRRMEEQTEHFPWIVKDFEAMKLPPKTIAGCEFVCYHPRSGRANIRMMQSLSRSLPARAQKIQEEDPFRRPLAIVLRFSVWRGEEIIKEWNAEAWIEHTVNELAKRRDRVIYVRPMEVMHAYFKEAVEYIKVSEKEGLVIYDADAVYGDMAANFRGEPERPECWKWKHYYEDDFIIMFKPDEGLGRYGNGRLKNLPGQYVLYQWDGNPAKDKKAELIYVSKCGSGDDEQRSQIMHKAAKSSTGCAGVGIVKFIGRYYESEGEQSNALREPVFLGWHPDKGVREVINKRLRKR